MGQKDYLHRQGQSGREDVHRKYKEEGAKPSSTTPDKGRWCVDVQMSNGYGYTLSSTLVPGSPVLLVERERGKIGT